MHKSKAEFNGIAAVRSGKDIAEDWKESTETV
jgi:hypothetical protein